MAANGKTTTIKSDADLEVGLKLPSSKQTQKDINASGPYYLPVQLKPIDSKTSFTKARDQLLMDVFGHRWVELATRLVFDDKSLSDFTKKFKKGLELDLKDVMPTDVGKGIGKQMAESFVSNISDEIKKIDNVDLGKLEEVLDLKNKKANEKTDHTQEVKHKYKLEEMEKQQQHAKELIDYRADKYFENYKRKVNYGRGSYANPTMWAIRNIGLEIQKAKKKYDEMKMLSASKTYFENKKIKEEYYKLHPDEKPTTAKNDVFDKWLNGRLMKISEKYNIEYNKLDGTKRKKKISLSSLKEDISKFKTNITKTISSTLFDKESKTYWKKRLKSEIKKNPLLTALFPSTETAKKKSLFKRVGLWYKDYKNRDIDTTGVKGSEQRTKLFKLSAKAQRINKIIAKKQFLKDVWEGSKPILASVGKTAIFSVLKAVLSGLIAYLKFYAGLFKRFLKFTLAPAKFLYKTFTSLLKKAVSQSQIIASIMEMSIVPFILLFEYSLLPVLKAITPPITNMVKLIASHTKDIMKFGDVFANIIKMFTSSDSPFNIFKHFEDGSRIWTNPIAGLGDVATTILKGISSYITTNAATIRPLLEEAFVSLLNVISASAGVSKAIGELLSECIHSVVKTPEFQSMVKAVVSTTTILITEASKLFSEPAIREALIELIKAIINGAWNAFRGFTSGIDTTDKMGDKTWWDMVWHNIDTLTTFGLVPYKSPQEWIAEQNSKQSSSETNISYSTVQLTPAASTTSNASGYPIVS